MEVRIKASLGDEMRRFRVPQAAAGDWPAFEAQVRSLFNIPGPMRIMYKDSDGDSVLMSSATELSEAMNDALAFGDTLRITVESAGGQQPPAPAAVPSAPRFDPTVFDPSADTLDASSPAAAAAAGGAPSSSSRSDPQQDQPTPAPTSGNSAGAGGAPPPFNAPPELQNLFRMVMPYVMEGCSHAAQAIAAEVAAHAPPVAHAPGSATAQGVCLCVCARKFSTHSENLCTHLSSRTNRAAHWGPIPLEHVSASLFRDARIGRLSVPASTLDWFGRTRPSMRFFSSCAC